VSGVTSRDKKIQIGAVSVGLFWIEEGLRSNCTMVHPIDTLRTEDSFTLTPLPLWTSMYIIVYYLPHIAWLCMCECVSVVTVAYLCLPESAWQTLIPGLHQPRQWPGRF